MVAERRQRRGRHRVDHAGAGELLDVLDVAVAGVLGAGRGPQQALRASARLAQGGEALAAEQLVGARVREPGVRDRGAAGEVVAAARGQQAVDRGVDARDEEARDRRDVVDRQAAALPLVEAGDVRVHHRGVRVEAEQQCDVDVDPVRRHAADRVDAGRRGRDLDHGVRPVQARP